MKILILGGTRFLGKKILDKLLDSDNNDIWVISRRNLLVKSKIHFLNMERKNGINSLKNKIFDLTIDFIAYEKTDIFDIHLKINSKKYIFISTTWITRLWDGNIANEFKSINLKNMHLPEITKRYLMGKYECEEFIINLIKEGFNAKSIRFPIILGEGDHTGRLEFYLERILDNQPLIQIKDINNKIQVSCVKNIASAFIEWIEICDKFPINVWEALPGDGIKSKDLIKSFAFSLDKEVKFIDIPKTQLEKYLPDFLVKEPFWREKNLKISDSNIYKFIKLKSKAFKDCSFANKVVLQTELRKREISYFAKFR